MQAITVMWLVELLKNNPFRGTAITNGDLEWTMGQQMIGPRPGASHHLCGRKYVITAAGTDVVSHSPSQGQHPAVGDPVARYTHSQP